MRYQSSSKTENPRIINSSRARKAPFTKYYLRYAKANIGIYPPNTVLDARTNRKARKPPDGDVIFV